jgi:hypothetical protein
MHSFENVTSIERKKANWKLIDKLFKVQLRINQPTSNLAGLHPFLLHRGRGSPWTLHT